MIPPAFEYAVPSSLSEAIGLLKSGGDGAKVIAGGQSIIPILKLRLASPTLLVDINRIPGLDYILESDGYLMLGALTRIADLSASSLLKNRYPIIHDASKVIADPQIRNLGTVGGNICHGDPANDLPAVMLAMAAEFVATGPSGDRSIKARDFFVDTFTNSLGHDEILTGVRVPVPPPISGGSYLKIEQKVADPATAGAAVQLTIDSEGQCQSLGVGLTAVGPKALLVEKAEAALKGKRPTERRAVGEVAALAADAADPVSDIRGPAGYKRELVRLLVTRALRKAYERARSRD